MGHGMRATENYTGLPAGVMLEGSLLGRPVRPALELDQFRSIDEVRANLTRLMANIRGRQVDDPSAPRRPFLKNLLSRLEDHLKKNFNLDPRFYKVRVFSAVDTVLDKNGMDFWVELVDVRRKVVLSDYKVDLTSNLGKSKARKLADSLYYYDSRLEELEGMQALYKAPDFKALVESAASNLFSRSGLQRAH